MYSSIFVPAWKRPFPFSVAARTHLFSGLAGFVKQKKLATFGCLLGPVFSAFEGKNWRRTPVLAKTHTPSVV